MNYIYENESVYEFISHMIGGGGVDNHSRLTGKQSLRTRAIEQNIILW